MTKILRTLILVLLLCILLAGLFAAYSWHLATQNNPTGDDDTVPVVYDSYLGGDIENRGLNNEITTTDSVRGAVLLTGRSSDPSETSIRNYTVNFDEEGKLTPLLSSGAFSAFISFQNKTEPDRFIFESVTASSAALQETNGYEVAPTLHIGNWSTGQIKSVRPDAGPDGTIRTLTMSPQGDQYAYAVYHAEESEDTPLPYEDLTRITNWTTVVANTATTTADHFAYSAVQPQWLPDGSGLLLLRIDGLYHLDLTTGLEELVKPLEAKVGDKDYFQSNESMIDLSPDGTHLVWTVPRLGMILVYEVAYNDTITLTELGRIVSDDTEYYWPQFSPDSQVYVVQAIDGINQGPDRTNPRMEVRPVEGRTVLKTVSLESLDFNALFTDDWVW